jgi:hypothetical protein
VRAETNILQNSLENILLGVEANEKMHMLTLIFVAMMTMKKHYRKMPLHKIIWRHYMRMA